MGVLKKKEMLDSQYYKDLQAKEKKFENRMKSIIENRNKKDDADYDED